MNPNEYPKPTCRRLRVYALDPSLQRSLSTLDIHETVLKVRWEDLLPGPIGEYVEVIDYDPASECFYAPVDLDNSTWLAQDGLMPFEGDPQFHQQMVYAVSMRTIENFERALGRKALWSAYSLRDKNNKRLGPDRFVRRLRIYPHALREANAYYSPAKKALLFGYFNARTGDPAQHMPGGVVFTCLSHDVVAHEITHALLDGQHPRLLKPTNPDVLAFHEAFADIVAIFQHFTMAEVLRHQIAQTRGDLASENLLAKLAIEFGRANARDALRDALGWQNPETGRWEAREPNPAALDSTFEPHDRGAILVAAVFDAFVMIYRRRTADLVRIASGGTGILADGELHPDLVNRLAKEAARAAQHVLTVCIRALDYLPPVDLTFGEYLRAIITSDYDLVRDDDLGYRVAFINAFSRRGIYPRDVRSLSVNSLLWQQPQEKAAELLARLLPDARVLKKMVDDWGPTPSGGWEALDPKHMPTDSLEEQMRGVVNRFLARDSADVPASKTPENDEIDRSHLFARSRYHALLLHYFIRTNWELIKEDYDEEEVSGLIGLKLSKKERPGFEVHIVRPVHRVGPDGQLRENLLVIITQRRRAALPLDDDFGSPHESDQSPEEDSDPRAEGASAAGDDQKDKRDSRLRFDFYGGCTLLLDARDGSVRYCILKNFGNENRLARQQQFLHDRLQNAAFDERAKLGLRGGLSREPLAMLHRAHVLPEERS